MTTLIKVLSFALICFFTLACNSGNDSEHENLSEEEIQEEMDRVPEMNKRMEERMDSAKKAMGLDSI